METHVLTPQDVFMQPQHLVVPPFQRPYVWEKEEQWAPFWQDVRRLAELRLSAPSLDARHFLGAIVVQSRDSFLGGLQANSIIDGQQRLTTLQLLMDAAAAAMTTHSSELTDKLAAQLERLTHNEEIYVPSAPTRLKLRHTNRDRAAFDEVMDAEAPVPHEELEHAGARLVRAHAYFMSAVTEWLEPDSKPRAQSLTEVLTRGLQLVAINLTANENSQEIFETLNARGTPLTASDLIKNFVFQRLSAEGADTRTHLDDWPFDTAFWEKDVTVGRHPMQRSSLFLNQWLIAQVGEEISPRATFTRFKQFVEQRALSSEPVADLLPLIRQQAELYERWTAAAKDRDRQLTRVEMAVYRMRASQTELLVPLLIWLHDPRRAVPALEIERIVSIVESWLVRRQLLRLSIGDMGRIIVELIRLNEITPAPELATSVEQYLSRLDVASTYWPGDKEIRESLQVEQVFRRFKRGRTRMLLEAIEDSYRNATHQPQVARDRYPIEHVLPQTWQNHWPVDSAEAEARRAEHVHRLGNLTLVTKSLNSKLSNGPWLTKHDALQTHDTLLVNSRLLAEAREGWDEQRIDARTDALIDVLLSIWPVPAGHKGAVVDPHEKDAGWVQIKHLVDAGVLAAGTMLTPSNTAFDGRTAVVRTDGLLEIDGKTFDTPSGAGRYVKGAVVNGWSFWRVPDGRKLRDIRAVYTGERDGADAQFDWTALHTILELIPGGQWTTYGCLADALGTSPQPLGQHVTSCRQCANAHRILKKGGRVAENFRWADPDDERDPVELLREEGVAVVDGVASPERELNTDDLQALIEQ